MAICFDLIYRVRVRFRVIGEFELPVMMIQMLPGAIVAQTGYGLIVFQ